MNALLSGNRRAADTIPFFNELPPKAIKAACQLWDAIQSPSYNGVAAYMAFVHNLKLHEIEPPPRAIVKRWASGIECGLIPRPAPETAPVAETVPAPAVEPDVETKVEAETPKAKAGKHSKRATKTETPVADVLVSHPATGEPVRPEIVAAIDDETRLMEIIEALHGHAEAPILPDRSAEEAIEAAVELMVQEIIAEMMADIEREARQRAAVRLAQRAERMLESL